MLFAMTLALLMALLTLFGQGFEQATILSIAALTSTGPLLALAGDNPIHLVDLGWQAKLVFAAGTVLGRLELLAIIALLNADLWRDRRKMASLLHKLKKWGWKWPVSMPILDRARGCKQGAQICNAEASASGHASVSLTVPCEVQGPVRALAEGGGGWWVSIG